MRVSQRRHDLGLLPQAGQVPGLPGQAGVENLDRDLAAQPLMGCHVDVAAPALGKRADDSIAAAENRPHRRGRAVSEIDHLLRCSSMKFDEPSPMTRAHWPFFSLTAPQMLLDTIRSRSIPDLSNRVAKRLAVELCAELAREGRRWGRGTMRRDGNDPVDSAGAEPIGDAAADAASAHPAPSADAFPVVGVGASAGGLEAFTQLLKHLPADSGMAFVLIQHLDPTHASFLPEALAKATTMTVSQPTDGTPVEPNHVYVIPPDADITMQGGLLALAPRTRDEQRPHLPIDLFLRSLAADARQSARSASSCREPPRTAPKGCGPSRRRTASRWRRIPRRRSSPSMPRSAMDAGVVDYRAADPRARRRSSCA